MIARAEAKVQTDLLTSTGGRETHKTPDVDREHDGPAGNRATSNSASVTGMEPPGATTAQWTAGARPFDGNLENHAGAIDSDIVEV